MGRITRLSTKRIASAKNSNEKETEPKLTKPKKTKNTVTKLIQLTPLETISNKNDSSSESDLDTYLKPADEIDLNSTFFHTTKNSNDNEFNAIENNIFTGVMRLSDSESEPEDGIPSNDVCKPTTSNTNKINFQQLHDYTKKIEEAKKVVEKYEARKKIKLKKLKKKNQTNENSISDLLAKGEAKVDSSRDLSKSLHSSDYTSFSDSEKEWEEVEGHELVEHTKSIVPKGGVQITVELPGVMRKKKGIDLVASMKRRLNRIRKENQVFVHKVHLLCWLAHGNYVNTVLNNEKVLAMAMSLLPSQHCYPSERTDLNYLEAVVKWFHNSVPVTDKLMSKNISLAKALRFQINRKRAYNKKMLVYIFICMLRALGIQCRLVLSFLVTPLRPPAEELHSLSIKNNGAKQSTTKYQEKSKTPIKVKTSPDKKVPMLLNTNTKESSVIKVNNSNNNKEKNAHKSKNTKKLDKKNEKIEKKHHKIAGHLKQPENKIETEESLKIKNKSGNKSKLEPKLKNIKGTKQDAKEIKKPNLKSLAGDKISSKSNTKREKMPKQDEANDPPEILQIDGANDSDSEPPKKNKTLSLKRLTQEDKNPCPIKKHPKRLKSLPNYADGESEDDFKPQASSKTKQANKPQLQKLSKSNSSTNISNVSPRKNDVHNDIIAIMKGRMAAERAELKNKLVKHKSNDTYDYDSDYAPVTVKKKCNSDDEFYEKAKPKVKQRVQVEQVSDKDDVKKKKGVNVWVEVYLENEEKWISADVTKGELHCINQLYSRATHPISYIVAWNNNNTVKDITQRYCTNWNTVTRKLRIDKEWWNASLRPFIGIKMARDKDEDEELEQLQLEQPLPTSISEYKNHPLYVLKRHLLKFQAIYPPDSTTLGFIRKEAVYARDCVHTLHSRETWLKHAKVVKVGEKPYKIVKARPKYDRLSNQIITDLPLEVFGKWQVEEYIPPTAKDGIVPRNAYGNVELFKACMLPKGTVHLQLPGLNKVAKKMNIDCVPAVVGFDIHSGWTHPTFDGFVVCEEFSEALIAAWYIDQEEQELKEQEKFEKRVYDNWKKLIKGLLIRERLKARYDYGNTAKDGPKNGKRKNKGPGLVTKKLRIYSDNESH